MGVYTRPDSLRHVTNRNTTNSSLRERFGIPQRNASLASRLLGEAVAAGVIVVADPSAGARSRRGVFFWAARETRGIV